MKLVYPVIFTEDPAGGYMAYVPDLEINTQGEDLAEAIAMARDAMGLVGIDMEDDGKPFPAPSQHVDCPTGGIVSLVDADLVAYRSSLMSEHSKRERRPPGLRSLACHPLNMQLRFQCILQDHGKIDPLSFRHSVQPRRNGQSLFHRPVVKKLPIFDGVAAD